MAIEQLELTSGKATLVPLEGGHLVIFGAGNIEASVVGEAITGAVDDLAASVILVRPAGECPGRGD